MALALLAAFVAIERRSAQPAVPLGIFRNAQLRGANALTLLNTGALFPMFFFLTLYTQDVLGYGPVESGLAQLPLAVTIAVSATLAPRLVDRTGYGAALVAGFTMLAGGLAWFATVPGDGSFAGDLLAPSLVIGIGEGLIWVSSMIGATSGVDETESGLASGIVNTSQQLGGALGIAVLVALATAHDALLEGLQAGFLGGAGVAAMGAIAALAMWRRQARGNRPAVPSRHDQALAPTATPAA